MDGPKPRRGQIDARRISDNAYVYIKVVRTDSAELCLLQFLNREELRDDPMNHCVPLLDVFQDDEDPDLWCPLPDRGRGYGLPFEPYR